MLKLILRCINVVSSNTIVAMTHNFISRQTLVSISLSGTPSVALLWDP
ncbi:unnamed protein product [Brassica napus]|uniref:(rape) hypothetical protein n=1 Tax=Brassica napus TaxID=3708 RepID=A0A816P560_BRANA|nr:unnamed protein product [Brassica napus]